jgi:DNA repair photolyase
MVTVHKQIRPSLGFENETTEAVRLATKLARGRGARSNGSGRYEALSRHLVDDGWESLEELPPFKTTVIAEQPKTILTRNSSPDISFDRSINPYRGCEHGCSYCYARPTHAYMGLSPGLDFESKLFAKLNAPELLRNELSDPAYLPQTIALGANTDPYQPIERQYRLTRQILEVLAEFHHPVGIVTKSALVVRDLDILQEMAKKRLVKVAVSVTTLDPKLARAMEPRAASPGKRLEALGLLAAAGVPTTVMVAPIIPALNDSEIGRPCCRHPRGRLCAAAPAARGEDDFQRVADRGAPRSGRSRAVADPPDPRRQGK